MIGLKEFMVNEVSSELLMKAAKKAKEIGDPRVEKFFNAAVEKAKKELDVMEDDAKKAAESVTKKVFNSLKKLGKANFGFGTQLENTLTFEENGRQGVLFVYAGGKGIIPTKGMYKKSEDLADLAESRGLDHISDKLEKVVENMDDNDPIIFVKILLAADKSVKGIDIYRNCNVADAIILPGSHVFIADRVLWGMYTEYRPDGDIYPPKLNIKDIEDDDIDRFATRKIAKNLYNDLGNNK